MSRLTRPSLIAAGLVTTLPLAGEGLQAQEGRWIEVTRRPGITFFIDERRVDTAGPKQYRLWVRRDYAVHHSMSRTPFNRLVSHVLVDCVQNRLKDLERTYYWGDRPQFGAPVPAEMQEWIEAKTDSVPPELAARGCLVAEQAEPLVEMRRP